MALRMRVGGGLQYLGQKGGKCPGVSLVVELGGNNLVCDCERSTD
jgi:hypothetical protein